MANVPASKTLSQHLRAKGNDFYKRAMVTGLSPVIKRSRLNNALEKYHEAAREASGTDAPVERSSAIKNCGVMNKRLAQEGKRRAAKTDGDYSRCLPYFRLSLKDMSEALMCGSSRQGSEWAAKLQSDMEDIYTEIYEITELMTDYKQRLRELYQAVSFLPKGFVLAGAKHNIANLLFLESIRLMEDGNYKDCLGCLHDIHQPIEQALSILGDDTGETCVVSLRQDLVVLRQDTLYHMSTAESLKARKQGERLLEMLMNDLEFVNMDLAWDAIDWFKQATLKAAELDLEQEAAASSYLGFINQTLFLSTSKAKKYYKHCLELVEAAKPRTFLTHGWYKQCITGFKKIQDAERQRDETEQQKEKEKILKTLSNVLTKLKDANTDLPSLIKYIYSEHAPPKPSLTTNDLKQIGEIKCEVWCLPGDEKKAVKKLLLKAIRDFHPDKVCKTAKEDEQDVKKKKALVEEITKMITNYYERIKLLD